MKRSSPNQNQISFLYPNLMDQLNPKNSLIILSKKIPWEIFESEFSKLYKNFGRPAKPIRLMTGLLILKQMESLSDQKIVEAWVRDPYMQVFCGATEFQWEFPCDPSELTWFRKRIGEAGVKKILEVSIAVHGKKALEKEVTIDTTVQEKNVTFPTDSKLYVKIISKLKKIASKEKVSLRRSYKRTIKKLIQDQRFASHPKNRKKARKSRKKLHTISGRLIRELLRKLSDEALIRYTDDFKLFQKVLDQKKGDKNKIYSLHEPEVYCMSKGKEHKKYEFGSKGSIVLTKNSGIIVGAMSFEKNVYDGHTLESVIEQVEALRGIRPKVGICDRGYRGVSRVGDTQIIIPKPSKKRATNYEKQKARKRFRRRAGIEPVIGHLKTDFRLGRNFLKGVVGDNINLMMAAAAFNFKKLMKQLEYFLNYIFFVDYLLKTWFWRNCNHQTC